MYSNEMSKHVAGLTWKYVPLIVNWSQRLSDFTEALMPHVRPNWTKDSLKVHEINTGLGVTNDLIGFSHANASEDDTVLLRVNGVSTELFIDRELELIVMCLLNKAKANISPPVYCEFDNGLCYGYVAGQTLEYSDVKDLTVLSGMAKSLAKLHSFQLPEGYCDKELSPVRMYNKLLKLLDHVEEDTTFEDAFISRDVLVSELAEMKYVMKGFTSPVVLCHNDLQFGNVIYDTKREKISFIDFEYAGLNHIACDIGNFFSEFAGIDPPRYNRYPAEEEQKRFIKMYLRETMDLKGKVCLYGCCAFT